MKKAKRKIMKYVFPLGKTGRTQLAVYLYEDKPPRVVKVRWDKLGEIESILKVWK